MSLMRALLTVISVFAAEAGSPEMMRIKVWTGFVFMKLRASDWRPTCGETSAGRRFSLMTQRTRSVAAGRSCQRISSSAPTVLRSRFSFLFFFFSQSSWQLSSIFSGLFLDAVRAAVEEDKEGLCGVTLHHSVADSFFSFFTVTLLFVFIKPQV